ncbi:MAG: hypothetical protein P4L45_06065, partial [Ignavibacteriaceae bacterium]|nr:hypothetical protein [Ignavibacteriaceae bacterium]
SHLNGWYVPKFLMAMSQGKAVQVLKGFPFYLVILYLILLILNYIYYLTIVLLFLIRIIKEKTFRLFDKKYLPVTLFIILGLLITLAAYGDARYNYPYMLFVILFIAEPVSRYLNGQRLFYNK